MIWMLRVGLAFATAKTLQYICIYYANVLENILTYIKYVNSVIVVQSLTLRGISRWMLL